MKKEVLNPSDGAHGLSSVDYELNTNVGPYVSSSVPQIYCERFKASFHLFLFYYVASLVLNHRHAFSINAVVQCLDNTLNIQKKERFFSIRLQHNNIGTNREVAALPCFYIKGNT